MQINTDLFGTISNQDVTIFTLKNDQGMIVKIMDYGATITSIQIPTSDGLKDIACGFDSLDGYFSEEYTSNAPYFGGTVGRYCSQIKDSKFSLNGKEYQLSINCGKNNLHGGKIGFDKKMWDARPVEIDNAVGVEFSLESKDLEEGFPGNVDIKVTYWLTNNNEIKIDYWAKSDQDTPLSMTNHTYFNLTGFKNGILAHSVKIDADEFQVCDETGAATGEIASVTGTPNDLRESILIGDAQKEKGGGYETFFLTGADFKLKKVAEVASPDGKIKLEASTTEPCMLFYTGIYTSDKLKRENGDQYGQFRGFCLETHRYQNGPNIPESPKTITRAGEDFSSTTIFKLTF